MLLLPNMKSLTTHRLKGNMITLTVRCPSENNNKTFIPTARAKYAYSLFSFIYHKMADIAHR